MAIDKKIKTILVFGMFYKYISKNNTIAMSREILEFSKEIDEQFDFVGKPFARLIEFILRFFN